MKQIILTPKEIASLLLLNTAVLDVLNADRSDDVMEELKATQAELNHFLFVLEKPLYRATNNCTRANLIEQVYYICYL